MRNLGSGTMGTRSTFRKRGKRSRRRNRMCLSATTACCTLFGMAFTFHYFQMASFNQALRKRYGEDGYARLRHALNQSENGKLSWSGLFKDEGSGTRNNGTTTATIALGADRKYPTKPDTQELKEQPTKNSNQTTRDQRPDPGIRDERARPSLEQKIESVSRNSTKAESTPPKTPSHGAPSRKEESLRPASDIKTTPQKKAPSGDISMNWKELPVEKAKDLRRESHVPNPQPPKNESEEKRKPRLSENSKQTPNHKGKAAPSLPPAGPEPARSETMKDNEDLFVVSRYDTPWIRFKQYHPPTLKVSKSRALYSSISASGTDGLGHGVSVLNAEISTALRFNLTYLHRVGTFGSLTKNRTNAIEQLFGWGRGEIQRSFVEENVCKIRKIHPTGNRGRTCPVCVDLAPLSSQSMDQFAYPGAGFTKIVNIPSELTIFANRDTRHNIQRRVNGFLKQHNQSNILFQMGQSHCDRLPSYSDFSLSRPWVYWKYWGLHQRSAQRGNPLSPFSSAKRPRTRPDLPFSESEFSVAVHVRRGDFLIARSRESITSRSFAQVIRTIQAIVAIQDGPVSRLPMAVYIYSEGRPKKGTYGAVQHDVSKMTHEYVDVNGTVRDIRWWQSLLSGIPPQAGSTGRKSPRLTIPRVELRIARDTVESLHEMISADVFIGSASGLSWSIVGQLTRGIAFLPSRCNAADWVCFQPRNGYFSAKQFSHELQKYTKAFETFFDFNNEDKLPAESKASQYSGRRTFRYASGKSS